MSLIHSFVNRLPSLRLALWSFAALTLGCASEPPPTVATLAIDGRNSANPSIAADGDFIAVVWSAATKDTTDVFLATSTDGGRSFSAPVQVNDVGGQARGGGEFPPRVALVPSDRDAPSVAVVWMARGATGGLILAARSADGGKTFSAATPVPGSVGPGNRGWHSVAIDSTGRVIVTWLDHREVSAAAAEHHHGSAGAPSSSPMDDPTTRAEPSKIQVASLDGSGSATITGGVCYCCKTSLAAAGRDVYAAWRHVYAGSERDIAVAASRDGGATFEAPVRVSRDGWSIDGCPENGPAIAVDESRRVHVAWPTPPDGKSDTPLALFYTSSPDGRSFTERARIPTEGPAGHVQMSASGNSSLVVWDETIASARRLRATRVELDRAGKPTFKSLAWPGDSLGNHPVVAST